MFDWFWYLYERWPRATVRVIVYGASYLITFGLLFGGLWFFGALPEQDAQAAGGGSPAECVEWADIKPWVITRCEGDWGEVCFMASSGMMACRFD